jgi:plastocyanin
MLRPLVALVVACALLSGSGAVASAASKPKVKCHWVKATKKRKRHKVCVKVKAKKKTPAKATKPAVSPSPSAPAASSPGASVPAVPAPVDPDPAPGPSGPDAPAPDGSAPAAARLQATTREWSITLSRPTVGAGALILQLVNRGEDAHDLHLRPAASGPDLLAIASTEPGTVADVSGTLAAGAYTLYCSLPGHEAAGMKATLTVQ